ncbi:gp45, partial [Listeria seeligeri FSL N1-067]
MKFEVGERVQFIYAGKLRTGGIKKFTQGKGEVYAHIEVDDTQACVRVTTDNIAKLDQPEQQSEKIKKINEIMLELIHRKDMDILNDDDITKMLIEALNIVNTLDEPKPVVVPKFVADWIEYCEKHRWGLSEALEDTYENSCMPEEVTDWLADCHENQELFARAWMGDYEVGEPLYYVR